MKIPSKKYIIIPKNSLHYPADRVLGNTHGPARASARAETSTNFRAEPPHYCHGNCKLNCEGMTECLRKWTPGLRCPSLRILMNDYRSVIPCPTKNPNLLKLAQHSHIKVSTGFLELLRTLAQGFFWLIIFPNFPPNPTITPFSSFPFF